MKDDEADEYKTEVKTSSGSGSAEEDIENYKNNRYGEATESECK